VSFLRDLLDDTTARTVMVLASELLLIVLLVAAVKRTVRSRVQDNALRYRASKIAVFGGYALALVLLLTQLTERLSGLTVALGASGVGVAFALQEVIASFAGWLAIALGGFYGVGDRVRLGGIKGDVIDIGFLRTTIMECGDWVDGDLYNGRVVRVANSFVFKEPVFNYSADFPFLWDEIVVPIKHGSDYELARRMLADAARKVVGEYTEGARAGWRDFVRNFRIEDAALDPMVTLVANDNWIALTLRYVVDPRARRLTKDALFTTILEAIEATQGRVAIASATFHLVEAPPLRVKMES